MRTDPTKIADVIAAQTEVLGLTIDDLDFLLCIAMRLRLARMTGFIFLGPDPEEVERVRACATKVCDAETAPAHIVEMATKLRTAIEQRKGEAQS